MCFIQSKEQLQPENIALQLKAVFEDAGFYK